MDVETNLGTVHIVNTHLGLGWRERLLQAQVFTRSDWHAAIAGDAPLILLGDFNSLPGSGPYRALTRYLRDVRELVPGTRSVRTFPTWFPALAVDHIFVNAALHPLSLTVHRSAVARIASDHFPLVAELVPASH
jgi:endonuclease/exonuclease/phosphatase family metal-dependent hydrolase